MFGCGDEGDVRRTEQSYSNARVQDAMMAMTKIDIAALDAAFNAGCTFITG
jgi:hypothetical protein